MNITTATPAEIDKQISHLLGTIARYDAKADAATEAIARISRRAYRREEDQAQVEVLEGDVQEYGRQAAELRRRVAPLDAEFTARGGWERYYLITDGHLHYDISSYRCSRVASSDHYWITELSGKPEAEVIEMAGDRVCTVCFPDAPVVVLNRPSVLLTKTEAEKDAARVERAKAATEKAAKAAAKAIVDPETGGELRVHNGAYSDTLCTERSAMIALVDNMWYQKYYSADDDRDAAIVKIAAALAAKHDNSVEVEMAAADKRLAARIKREG